MRNKATPPTLIDPEATGGDIAEGGFKFQDHLILARVPAWLAADGFTGMIREALGDTEARFFAPSIGMSREFVEYKNHNVPPSQFWPEIESFRAMDEGHPGSYHRFALVCTGVSDTLRPMLNALRRVREAFPFYSDAPTVQNASYRAFLATVTKLGKDETLARFVFSKVFVDTDPPKSQNLAFEVFRESLERHMPHFQELPRKHPQAAWNALAVLVGGRKAKQVSRGELETAIWGSVDAAARPNRPLRVFTASEPLTDRWDLPAELRFDWEGFSGGESRAYPPQGEWNRLVVGQLTDTRDWIIETKRRLRIDLSGRRRLSANVAIGAVFNATGGFVINMHYREEIWSTDDHAAPDTPLYAWNCEMPTGVGAELAVAIGIGRDPAPEVKVYLKAERRDMPLLKLFGTEVIVSAAHANIAVRDVKAAISMALVTTGAKALHLFLATPAHFALFLGHRLNATANVQCYERIGLGMYQPTCCLKAC